MRAPNDLHPDDAVHRLALRDLLVEARVNAHISQAQLAGRIGVAQSAVARFETRDPQRMNVSRRIADGLGMRVVAYPDGLPGGPYDDPTLLAFRPPTFAAAAAWDQRQLMSSLSAARRALGLTQANVAALLVTTESAISEFERTTHGLLFGSVQRHCRALGGFLWLGVETLPQVEAVAA